ncbi:oxidoreductase UcpA [Abditibacteriota bacterium]|nr:oxidoreductase UcpA [Abditibacteriota bacterium]
MKLAGKVAFITGAGSGIGKATALLFAQEGAKVVALATTPEEIDRTVAQIKEVGGEAIAVEADISKPKEVERAVKKALDAFGQLDIVFANAGINGVWAPIEELEPDDWDKTINTNLRGTFLTLKYTFPFLKERGGAMLVTSSVNGTRVFKGERIAYSCTKAGQVVLVKSLAVDFAKHGVRINAICPGAIETNIDDSTKPRDVEEVGLPVEFPEGRMPLNKGIANHVAQLALFLASDASQHITGTEVWIDGGETLVM